VILVGIVAALAGLAVGLDRHFAPPPVPDVNTESGISAAALMATSFPDLDGRTQSLGQWQGKLLVINFWATWCAPCRDEMPTLNHLRAEYANKGVEIVGITGDLSAKARQFVMENNISYPILVDSAGATEFSRRLGNRLGLLPHTVVFDPEGKRIMAKLGPISERELAMIIMENAPK
jgi:thiol-disulfide isomerase/thioredoxin